MMVHEFCKKEGYCVKYIFQFARITAFCLAGEVLAAGLRGVEDVPLLYRALEKRGYGQLLLEDIFWNNLRRLL